MASISRIMVPVCVLAGCGPGAKKYVPATCGTSPADSTKITLTGATKVSASPAVLEIPAGQKGLLNVTGVATHNAKNPEEAPMLCGAVFNGTAGITPLGFAIGNAIHPIRNEFRFEVGAIVECSAAGYIVRLDNHGDFARESDVTVGLLVPSDPIPLIGERSNLVHVRCIGGSGVSTNPSPQPVCGCTGTGAAGSIALALPVAAFGLRRRRSRKIPKHAVPGIGLDKES